MKQLREVTMSDVKKKRTPEEGLYLAGWIILAAIMMLLALKQLLAPDLIIIEQMRPCNIYTWLGFYCPGCGGSRSVAALVHGRFLVCAVNFPLVAYSAFMYVWFMVSHTIQRISGHRLVIGLKWRMSYLWIALAVLVLHFVVKNVFYFATGTPPFL